jgi:nitrite reductase/ring-hydroxylating ferredoxin subunit
MGATEGTRVTRRGIMAAGIAAGATPLLVSCGFSGSGGGDGTPAEGGSAAPIRTADIPVGGGTVFQDQQIVVTQPKAGEFKAFSAFCTHAQCWVTTVKDGAIDCPCHGSRFSITDGSVLNGPALQPLSAKSVTVNGDQLTVA